MKIKEIAQLVLLPISMTICLKMINSDRVTPQSTSKVNF